MSESQRRSENNDGMDPNWTMPVSTEIIFDGRKEWLEPVYAKIELTPFDVVESNPFDKRMIKRFVLMQTNIPYLIPMGEQHNRYSHAENAIYTFLLSQHIYKNTVRVDRFSVTKQGHGVVHISAYIYAKEER